MSLGNIGVPAVLKVSLCFPAFNSLGQFGAVQLYLWFQRWMGSSSQVLTDFNSTILSKFVQSCPLQTLKYFHELLSFTFSFLASWKLLLKLSEVH